MKMEQWALYFTLKRGNHVSLSKHRLFYQPVFRKLRGAGAIAGQHAPVNVRGPPGSRNVTLIKREHFDTLSASG